MNLKNLLNPFSRSKSIPREVKSNPIISPRLLEQMISFSDGNTKVTTAKAIFYYMLISAVATSVDLIAEEFEVINPLIYDEESMEFIKNHPMLTLLDKPNANTSGRELFGEIGRYYEITGNSYVIATGVNIDKPPIELISVPPQNVSIVNSTKDSFPETYRIDTVNGPVYFNRIEDKRGFRFINERGELKPMKYFNPKSGEHDGLSKLNPLYLELEQFFRASKHNLNIIKKGVRSSGAITSEDQLTPDQRDYIREQVNESNVGEDNAGKIFVFDGGKFSFHEMSKSLKDMDFRGLRSDMSISIYNRLKVPLPLVSTENQKFDNMKAAKLSLYDNAVLPLTDVLYQELGNFLLPRYGMDTDRFSLSYNILDIPELAARELEKVKAVNAMRNLTINEQRKLLGYDAVQGGDVLYQPFNLVPIGTSIEANNEGKGLIDKKKKEFRAIAAKQTNEDGTKLYTERQIDDVTEKYFGSIDI